MDSTHTIIERTAPDGGSPPISGQIDEQTYHPFWSSKKESRRGINRQKCLRLDQLRRELDFYEYPRRDYPMFSWEIFGREMTRSETTFVRVEKLEKWQMYIYLSYGIWVSDSEIDDIREGKEVGIMDSDRGYFIRTGPVEWSV